MLSAPFWWVSDRALLSHHTWPSHPWTRTPELAGHWSLLVLISAHCSNKQAIYLCTFCLLSFSSADPCIIVLLTSFAGCSISWALVWMVWLPTFSACTSLSVALRAFCWLLLHFILLLLVLMLTLVEYVHNCPWFRCTHRLYLSLRCLSSRTRLSLSLLTRFSQKSLLSKSMFIWHLNESLQQHMSSGAFHTGLPPCVSLW